MSMTQPAARLARFVIRLENYKFNVVYREGKKHGNSDALSRLPLAKEEETEEDSEKENEFLICQNVEVIPVNLEDDPWKNRQLTDPDEQWIHDLLKTSCEQIPTVTETLNPIQSAQMRDYDNLSVRGRYV